MLNILMYHKINFDNKKESNPHYLSISNFEKQMKILTDKNVVIAEDNKKCKIDTKYYSITFDDGAKSDYTIAFKILKKYNLRASFYIITSRIDSEGYLSKEEIIEMHKSGMKIGSHTHTHAKLSLITEDMIYQELNESKKILEDILGEAITSISVPGGFYNNKVVTIAKQIGYETILTSDFGFNSPNETVLKRNTVKEYMNFDRVLNNNLYIKIYGFRYYILWLLWKYT